MGLFFNVNESDEINYKRVCRKHFAKHSMIVYMEGEALHQKADENVF